MKFHWPSFLIGYGAGFATSALAPRIRPLVVELATAGYRLADGVLARVVMVREHLEDILVDARVRARDSAGPVEGETEAIH